jgi:hypothetical protein
MTKYIYDENTLELKEVKQKYLAKSIKFILVLFILMLIIKVPGSQNTNVIDFYLKPDTVYVTKNARPMTMENLAKKIAEERPKFGDITFAQTVCESGRLKSELALKANNITGMQVPGNRPTRVARELCHDQWAHFYSWEDCIEDLRLWQAHIAKNHLQDRNEYLIFLDGFYERGGADYQSSIEYLLLNDKEVITLVNKYKLNTF